MAVRITNLEHALTPVSGATMQKLAMDGSAKTLADLNSLTTHVFYTVEAGAVRVTFDGSTPSGTNGHLLAEGRTGFWKKETAKAAKFYQTGTTVVNVSEFAI